MFKLKGLRSWNMHASDLEVMTRFYRDILGAESRATQTIEGVRVERLRLGETGIGLFDAAQRSFPGVPHHTFDMEGPGDPDDLVRELEAKGVRVDGVRRHGQGRGYSVYVLDPSGNRIELSTDFG